MKINIAKCQKCQYVWIARVNNPKQCTMCKRYGYVVKGELSDLE